MEIGLPALAQRLAAIRPEDLRPLAGGASSLTYSATVTVDGVRRRAVVKVAPAGLEPVRNRDVLRQARLLRALHDSDVPVPEVLFEDLGAPPGDPPLFVMSFLPGTSVEPLFDHEMAETPPVIAERLHDAARVLARLHTSDPAPLGLADEPVVGPADELARWTRLLDTVDPALAPGWGRVAERLHDSVPESIGPTIVHGDLRLGNTLATGPTITAVIDWEIWCVGDPRVDLGWFLINADPATYGRSTPYVGLLPSPGDLLATYARHVGREIPALTWFSALACFKATATWALIVKHNRRRDHPDPDTEAIARRLPALLARATSLLDDSPARRGGPLV